jgi:hypothetical protein
MNFYRIFRVVGQNCDVPAFRISSNPLNEGCHRRDEAAQTFSDQVRVQIRFSEIGWNLNCSKDQKFMDISLKDLRIERF